MSIKKQRKEKRKEEKKINHEFQFQCPTIDELSDYVNGKMKEKKEKSTAIEKHAYGSDGDKGCTTCFKRIASLNGASQTLVNVIG